MARRFLGFALRPCCKAGACFISGLLNDVRLVFAKSAEIDQTDAQSEAHDVVIGDFALKGECFEFVAHEGGEADGEGDGGCGAHEGKITYVEDLHTKYLTVCAFCIHWQI